MNDKKPISLDILFPDRREKKKNESPLGKPRPVKYELDAERPSKTVKFVMHSNDDYASITSELEEMKEGRERLRDLVLEVLQELRGLKDSCPDSLLEWERGALKVLDEIYNKPFDTGRNARKITGYFNIGTYADTYPGELLIYTGKQGHETHGWVNSFGKAISMLLQYGVDPQEIYDEFKWDEFKPNGITNVKQAPICKSIVDLVIRYMESNFIPTRKGESDDDADYFAVVDTIVDQEK